MSSRTTVLQRVRRVLRETPSAPGPVPRDYLRHAPGLAPDDREAVVSLFEERLRGYGAEVRRVTEGSEAEAVRDALDASGATSVVVPEGAPEAWIASCGQSVLRDLPPLTTAQLDRADAVLTGCAGGVADSGTLVLDGGAAQGRRAPTLLPDVHVCVVRQEQIVSGLAELVPALDPRRPLTWFSGPSATVDIEMVRVQGVHGPRHLHIVLTGPDRPREITSGA